jgi:hypothetical protein
VLQVLPAYPYLPAYPGKVALRVHTQQPAQVMVGIAAAITGCRPEVLSKPLPERV